MMTFLGPVEENPRKEPKSSERMDTVSGRSSADSSIEEAKSGVVVIRLAEAGGSPAVRQELARPRNEIFDNMGQTNRHDKATSYCGIY